ncbi:hypothetical protein F5Y03DRAFT_47466 [Xylaria venustula]|nr:hypothetical protein F5Y03DRAFT_47466 [Xylaria venustula]
MRINTLGPFIACVAGLFGVAVAAFGGIGDNGVSSQHIHRLYDRGPDPPHPLTAEEELQLEKGHGPQNPYGPVYRCHDPYPEIFGPAPPVEDCNDVIKQFTALTTEISVKLVEGCYQIVSGNCTGLVCPQRPGESTISGAQAAQYMATPVRDECIAHGQRGWWIDGQGWGVGVYLT